LKREKGPAIHVIPPKKGKKSDRTGKKKKRGKFHIPSEGERGKKEDPRMRRENFHLLRKKKGESPSSSARGRKKHHSVF